MLYHSLLYNIT